MKLQPKKVQYSTRQGLTIEWQRPNEIVISADDLVMLLLCLKGSLTQVEMDQHFKPDEQEAIQKYFIQAEQKHATLMEQYRQKASFKKIKADFRHTLDWWKACYEEGIQQVMSQLWGWTLSSREALPTLDRLILGALESDVHHDIPRMKYLIASYMSMGDANKMDPLAETIAKVEAIFGPLNWEQLKAEGQQKYEQSHSA